MTTEKAIVYYKLGFGIRRKSWSPGLIVYMNAPVWQDFLMLRSDLLAEDWEVVLEKFETP